MVEVDSVLEPELSENQMREYNYALTEATKQKLFGNYKQAAALYKKCIEVNPNSDAAFFQLSGIYMIGRDFEAAKRMNLQAVKLNPDNYWYRIQLAQIYLMNQQSDSAVVMYESILSKWPEKIEIKYELSRMYAETGEEARVDDLIILPLAHFGVVYHFSKKWSLIGEFDGTSFKTDQILEWALLLRWRFHPRWELTAGYRWQDRDIETSDLNNKLRVDRAVVAMAYYW